MATCMNSICIFEREEIPNLVSVNLLFFLLCQKLKDAHCFVFFDNFFTSPPLLVKLLEMGIYATGTVKANRKNIPFLKHDKEM